MPTEVNAANNSELAMQSGTDLSGLVEGVRA